MSVLENKNAQVLLYEKKCSGEAFKKGFIGRLEAALKQRGYLNGSRGRTKIEFAKKVGITDRQLSRNLSLECFSRICIELQVDPVELLGLVWTNNKGIRNHIVTQWRVDNNLSLGGLRLYWICDICEAENLEYLDPDFKELNKLETAMRYNYNQRNYEETELHLLKQLINCTSHECEKCGEFYLKLKGLE